jgi:hypothetical protein
MPIFATLPDTVFRLIFASAVLLFLFSAESISQNVEQNYDMDAEIARLSKEIARVNAERVSVRAAAVKDKNEFAEYQEKMLRKREAANSEKDSVQALRLASDRRIDSLGSALTGIDSRLREIALESNNVRSVLISCCEKTSRFTHSLPPSIADQFSASISFLKSEISSGTADNMESLGRLASILNDIEARLMEIQIIHGISPVPAIPGSCYRIRIGGIFEALVNEQGERCAVWSGNTRDGWQVINDVETAKQILKSVNIREGKTIPEIIDLPLAGSGGQDE